LGLSIGAAIDHAWLACATIATVGLMLSLRIFQDCATATATVVRALKQLGIEEIDGNGQIH
jgi:hypothetical protein